MLRTERFPAADDAGRLPASQFKSPFQGNSKSFETPPKTAQCSRHNYQPLNLTDLLGSNSESLILFETTPAAIFLHRRPLHCSGNYHSCAGGLFLALAATSSAPAATSYQPCTGDFPAPADTSVHFPAPADTGRPQQIPTDTSDRLPAPADTSVHFSAPADTSSYQSWTSEHHPAPADTIDRFPAPADTNNYQSWTSEHLPAPADTSPKPATTYPTNTSLVPAVQTCSSD